MNFKHSDLILKTIFNEHFSLKTILWNDVTFLRERNEGFPKNCQEAPGPSPVTPGPAERQLNASVWEYIVAEILDAGDFPGYPAVLRGIQHHILPYSGDHVVQGIKLGLAQATHVSESLCYLQTLMCFFSYSISCICDALRVNSWH